MAQAFLKFQSFTYALGQEKHNFSADTLRVLFLNTAPSVSADAVKADLPTDLSTGGGYTQGTGPSIGTLTWATSSGTATLSASPDPFVFSASGASVGPFQYAVIYNDSAPNDELIGYWDLGAANTVVDGGTLELDMSVTGILTVV